MFIIIPKTLKLQKYSFKSKTSSMGAVTTDLYNSEAKAVSSFLRNLTFLSYLNVLNKILKIIGPTLSHLQ